MTYTSIMGTKHSTNMSNDEVKNDIISLSTNVVGTGTKNEECPQPETIEEISGQTLFGNISNNIQERSGRTLFGRISNNIPENDVGVCRNITVILQHPIDVSGEIPVPIVVRSATRNVSHQQLTTESTFGAHSSLDTVGCGCMDVCACSEGRLQGVKMDMRTESRIIKCQCKQPCTCVTPCECTKTDSIPVKSSWSVPHIFTKITDLEKRLDDIEVQFHKLKESLNNHENRIDTL